MPAPGDPTSLNKVLVTGASGFVGRQLCSEARARGWVVRAAVRIGTGPAVVAVGNIDGSTDWRRALSGIHVVVHLAGRAHVMVDGAEAADAYRRTNVDGTNRLARQAADAGVQRFVFLSSIKVVGEETQGDPYTEATPPKPEDLYGKSKWAAEQSLWDVGSQTGLSAVVVRAPLIYGPHPKGNILRLLEWIRRGIPLPFASIENKRSLLGVGNLIDLLLTCATHDRAQGEVFHVADGEDISTSQLVRFLASGLEQEARMFRCPVTMLRLAGRLTGRSAFVRRIVGDLQVSAEKAQDTLKWVPRFSLRSGLEAAARSFVRPAL